ncbi:MAG TPA: YggT family protein [Gemmatimonadales bacterium]|nr:YggT family protein [Gemmatimonadales bacterium]
MPLALLRYLVFAAFLGTVLLALGAWAVRTRRVSPFSALGQALRSLTDPAVIPLERWLVRRGGNPGSAPWWLVGIALVGGILLISLVETAASQIGRIGRLSQGGPRGVLRLLVYYAGQLVLLAIVVRVIASWLGAFRYGRWMRPVYALTDWLIEPLRRVIPPIGMIDITPIVAWFGLQLVVGWLVRVI